MAPIAKIATMALFTSCGVNVVGAWTEGHRYQVAVDYVAGEPGVGVAELVNADNVATAWGWLMLLAMVAAAMAFLTWLWRARVNAEQLCRAEHRHTRGWTVGAWFVPFVNLLFPLQIVDDVWRTSRPGVPKDTYRVDDLDHSRLVSAWWFAMLANLAVYVVGHLRSTGQEILTLLRSAAVYSTASALVLFLAAVLLSRVIRQITRWQTMPREAV